MKTLNLITLGMAFFMMTACSEKEQILPTNLKNQNVEMAIATPTAGPTATQLGTDEARTFEGKVSIESSSCEEVGDLMPESWSECYPIIRLTEDHYLAVTNPEMLRGTLEDGETFKFGFEKDPDAPNSCELGITVKLTCVSQ